MAKLGQTCKTCVGTCCMIGIEYIPTASMSGNMHKYIHKSREELLNMGCVERTYSIGEKPLCPSLTSVGKCMWHGVHKPKLCSSYWCGGKLWKAKNIQ